MLRTLSRRYWPSFSTQKATQGAQDIDAMMHRLYDKDTPTPQHTDPAIEEEERQPSLKEVTQKNQ